MLGWLWGESTPASGGALIMLRLKTHPLAAGDKGFLRVVENGSRRKNKNQNQRKKREAGKFRFRFGRSPGSSERF